MSEGCTSCSERENHSLGGALGFVPVYFTVQDQALLCPCAAGEVLDGARDGTQQASTRPQAPCHHLLKPSGAADASQHHIISWTVGFSLASSRGTCAVVLHLTNCSITCVTPGDSLWCSCWVFTLVLLLSARLSVCGDWLMYVVFACWKQSAQGFPP